MATGLLDIIKCAASDGINASKPVELRYGNVVSVNPLKIQVANDFTIPESMLIVPQHLTEYSVEINAKWTINKPSDDSTPTDDSIPNYDYELRGADMITIDGSLQVGDRVAMLRQQGGHSYYVLDKI